MVSYGVHLFLWAERFDRTTLHLIEKAKRLGFDGVEIPLMELDLIDIDATKRELRRHDMYAIGSLGLSIDNDVTSDDENVRRRGIKFMKRCVDVMAQLNGDSINGIVYTAWGKLTGRARTEDEWKRSVEALREVCRYARDYNVTFGLEPLNRFETHFLNTAEDAVKLVRDINEPNVKVHLDTFHMNIEEKNFYDPIKLSGRLLFHMHCCENDRGIPGTGHINWDDIFRALSEINYDRWLVIESFTQEMGKIVRYAAIWRKLAPNADAIAIEGVRFLKNMADRYGLR
ncbi:MAG: sugar phosphate isomerase/epimerase [Nitrososphaerota archaeon]|nr:sugar phosphate isomerase/epimerase [Candidatus Calditenuaceae archaeon]MDW8073393.1 sugar phosphate isomerase/epimerase [Nitrososphaerota archaeon]